MTDDTPTTGFYCIPNDILRTHGAAMGLAGIAVYNVLMMYANKDGECWPSYQTIADMTGASRPTIIKTIAHLIELGVISKRDGPHLSNTYRITSKDSLLVEHETSKEFLPPSKESLPEPVKNFYPPSKESLPKQEPRTIPIEQNPMINDPRVRALRDKLHSVGVMLNPFIVDQYMALSDDDGIDFEYVLRGITAAAENQKQHHFRYVTACIRNAANGKEPDKPKTNDGLLPWERQKREAEREAIMAARKKSTHPGPIEWAVLPDGPAPF